MSLTGVAQSYSNKTDLCLKLLILIFISYFLHQIQHSILLGKLNLKVRLFLLKTTCLTWKMIELAIVGEIYNACKIQQEMFNFYKTLCPTWLYRAYLKAALFLFKTFHYSWCTIKLLYIGQRFPPPLHSSFSAYALFFIFLFLSSSIANW